MRRDREFALVRKKKMIQVLEAEPRDDKWASETETELEKAVQQLDPAKFPGTKVALLECRSTMCRMEVDTESLLEQSRFPAPTISKRRAFGLKRHASEGDKTGWTLFIARDGHNRPRVERPN